MIVTKKRDKHFVRKYEERFLNGLRKTHSNNLHIDRLTPQELITLKWLNVNLCDRVLYVKKALNRVIEFDDD